MHQDDDIFDKKKIAKDGRNKLGRATEPIDWNTIIINDRTIKREAKNRLYFILKYL